MKTRIYDNFSDILAKDHAATVARRNQRRLEREADPDWQAVRRERAERIERARALEDAQKAEAAKHAMVPWPSGLSAHVDRGSARAKASFVRYLAQAVADYERDHPDQAPAPLIDVETAALERREAESRARARLLMEGGIDLMERAKMLETRHAYIGDQEFAARLAIRQELHEIAADPHGGEHPVDGESSPTPVVASHDAEPVKRGRGRPRKIQTTDDGAILEDDTD